MRNRIGRSILCLACAMSSVAPLRSQSTNEKPRFEVASVRPNVSGEGTGRMTVQGDRFRASCVPFVTLGYAWNVSIRRMPLFGPRITAFGLTFPLAVRSKINIALPAFAIRRS